MKTVAGSTVPEYTLRITIALGSSATSGLQSLKEAVVTSIYLKINARILTTAMAMGTPIQLSSGEIESMSATQLSPLAMDRMWEAFCRRAGLEVT